jgi:hypothetical protein
MDKDKSFIFLITFIIILNILSLLTSNIEDKLLSVASFKFDPFSIEEDAIILSETIVIIISMYLLFTYKISNVFIIALLLYYIIEKFMEEFIILNNEKIQKTYQPIFFNINNWLKKIFFVVQLYVLYCIFFTNSK